HYSVDGQWITTTQAVMHWNFHSRGPHDIALYVKDDLGLDSDTIHKQIVVQ
ncbi:MAG: hypothetical protein JWN76_2456, partial [Chitinophagaceae bacterium]|nr:hypothetical protein [Chitinophagaceae bacterium]